MRHGTRSLGLRAGAVLRTARRWAFRTAKAYRKSLYPETELEVQLVGAQMKMIRAATWPMAWILPPAALLIAWANTQWIPVRPAAIWFALISSSVIILDIVYRHVERHTGDDANGIGKRVRTFFALTVFQSAVWSTMAILLWAPGQPLNHMLLILILASTISGWSAIGSVHLAIGRAPLVCYAAGMVLPALLAGDTLDHALAGMC